MSNGRFVMALFTVLAAYAAGSYWIWTKDNGLGSTDAIAAVENRGDVAAQQQPGRAGSVVTSAPQKVRPGAEAARIDHDPELGLSELKRRFNQAPASGAGGTGVPPDPIKTRGDELARAASAAADDILNVTEGSRQPGRIAPQDAATEPLARRVIVAQAKAVAGTAEAASGETDFVTDIVGGLKKVWVELHTEVGAAPNPPPATTVANAPKPADRSGETAKDLPPAKPVATAQSGAAPVAAPGPAPAGKVPPVLAVQTPKPADPPPAKPAATAAAPALKPAPAPQAAVSPSSIAESDDHVTQSVGVLKEVWKNLHQEELPPAGTPEDRKTLAEKLTKPEPAKTAAVVPPVSVVPATPAAPVAPPAPIAPPAAKPEVAPVSPSPSLPAKPETVAKVETPAPPPVVPQQLPKPGSFDSAAGAAKPPVRAAQPTPPPSPPLAGVAAEAAKPLPAVPAPAPKVAEATAKPPEEKPKTPTAPVPSLAKPAVASPDTKPKPATEPVASAQAPVPKPSGSPGPAVAGKPAELPQRTAQAAAAGGPRSNLGAPLPKPSVAPVAPQVAAKIPASPSVPVKRESEGKGQGWYIVKDTDTLSQIAQRVYGRPEAYLMIYRANRGRIRNPNVIWEGMRIRLP